MGLIYFILFIILVSQYYTLYNDIIVRKLTLAKNNGKLLNKFERFFIWIPFGLITLIVIEFIQEKTKKV